MSSVIYALLLLACIGLAKAYLSNTGGLFLVQNNKYAYCHAPRLRITKTETNKISMKIPGIEFLVQALSPKPSTFSPIPIIAAVQDRDEGKVRALLAQGADANGYDPAFGNSMHWIAEKGHYQYPPSGIPKLLVDAGLDPNAKNPSGATALEISLLRGWQKISMLLLDRGADRGVVTEAVKSRITCPDCKKVVRDYSL